jgi:hypothetical protein
VNLLEPTADEAEFFSNTKANAALYPIDDNTPSSMLYFLHFQKIQLVSGYSGRENALFWALKTTFVHPMPQNYEITHFYLPNKVDTVIFNKTRYSPEQINMIQKKFPHILFENKRFLVSKLEG